MTYNFSIKTRLIIAFMVFSATVSGVISILLYSRSSSILRTQIEKELLLSTQLLAEKYVAWLDIQYTGLETVAADFDVNSNDPANTPFFNEHAKRLGFNSMSPADLQGGLHLPTGAVVDASKRDYMQYMLKNQKRAVSEPLASFDDKGNISLFASLFAVPVFKNGVFTGGLVAQKDAMFLSETLKTVNIGKGGYNYILSPSGNLLAHTDDEEMKSQPNALELAKTDVTYKQIADIHKKMIAGESGIAEYNKKGTLMVIAYSPIKELGWSVGVACPAKIVYSELTVLLRGVIVLFFVSLVCSFVLAYIVGIRMVTPLRSLVSHFKVIATGNADLTQRLPVKGNDELSSLESGFNDFVSMLHLIIVSLKDTQKSLANIGSTLSISSSEAASSVDKLFTLIENVQDSADKQAESSNNASSGLKSIVEGINELSSLIAKQVADSDNASSAVEEMVSNISSVTTSVETMSNHFTHLTQIAAEGKEKQDVVNTRVNEIVLKSQLLQEANSVIEGISSQTNLLAMNAAIEAAHAGDAGKGFSVVADEIRKLSETSAEQTHQIGSQLEAITQSISSVVEASNQSASTFDALSDGISDVTELVAKVTEAMVEQKIGSKQVLDTLLAMTRLGSEVKTQSAEMESASEQSLKSIQKLADSASYIKTSLSKMNEDAKSMNDTTQRVSGLADKTHSEIQRMESEIGKFIV